LKSVELALKDNHAIRLRVFGNVVPRRIIGPKREEITAGWRQVRNEKLQNLYS
jgi:hypothetical protein